METDGVQVGPGGVMIAHPDEIYGPHTAGPEGYFVAEFFNHLKGAYLLTSDTPNGPRRQNTLEYVESQWTARAEDAEGQ